MQGISWLAENLLASQEVSKLVGFSLRWRVVGPSMNLKDRGPPVFSCPRLIIQYIGGYSLYAVGGLQGAKPNSFYVVFVRGLIVYDFGL